MSNGEGINNNNGINDVNVSYTFAHPMQAPGLNLE